MGYQCTAGELNENFRPPKNRRLFPEVDRTILQRTNQILKYASHRQTRFGRRPLRTPVLRSRRVRPLRLHRVSHYGEARGHPLVRSAGEPIEAGVVPCRHSDAHTGLLSRVLTQPKDPQKTANRYRNDGDHRDPAPVREGRLPLRALL